MRGTLPRVSLAVLLLAGLTSVGTQAQRSGAATRPNPTPTNGPSLQPDFRPNRFLVFVFANPVTGKDAEFDDWYENEHVPDLLEHPGYFAAQRFRLAVPGSFTHTRLVIWHVEGDRELSQRYVQEALQTGKTRRSDAFPWGVPGGQASGTFEPISERVVSASGGPTVGDLPAGKKRFVFFEYASPIAGRENLFNAQAERRLRDVVTVPGWVAGQIYKSLASPAAGRAGQAAPPSGRVGQPAAPSATPAPAPASGAAVSVPPLPLTRRFLTIYDVEATDVKAALEARTKAEQAGKIRLNTTTESGAAAFFLEPISRFIKKEEWHPAK